MHLSILSANMWRETAAVLLIKVINEISKTYCSSSIETLSHTGALLVPTA